MNGKFRKKKVNFSQVSNDLLRNSTISLKAKGLYALIQSYITLEDFTLYKRFLQSNCREGTKAFESAWDELKKSGYLVQYKLKDDKNRFFYEYELLDEVASDGKADGYDSHTPKMDGVENGGCINNIGQNQIENNNINQIISMDYVRCQINYEVFAKSDKELVDNIVLLMVEVMNLKDDEIIRIAKHDTRADVVKARFRKINHLHIEYVLESLKKCGNIRNIKAYLMITLFNSLSTIDYYYQNKVNQML